MLNHSCGERSLLIEAGQPWPSSYVGSECATLMVTPDLCLPRLQHLEAPHSHPASVCAKALADQPVQVLKHHDKDEDKTLVSMARCRAGGGSLFWALQLLGSSFETGAVNHEHVVARDLLCVPPGCGVYEVGVWITPVLTISRPREVYWSVTPLVGWKLKGRDSVCRHGCTRLPPRGAWPVADSPSIRSQLGRVSKQIFRLSSYSKSAEAWIQQAVMVAEQRLPRPFAAAVALQQRTQGIAVVFAGEWRFGSSTAETIDRHVVKPLGARVFAVMSGAPRSRGIEEREAMLGVFGDALARFDWVRDAQHADLAADLTHSGALELYLATGGWAFTPLTGTAGKALHALRKIEASLSLVEEYEEEQGRRFEWLIFSRTDLIWMVDHPPTSLLQADCIWTMEGQDWHVLVPRNLAGPFFKRWTLLRGGEVPALPQQNPITLMHAALATSGVREGVLPLLASLEHCAQWSCYAWTVKPSGVWRFPRDRRVVARVALALKHGRLKWAPSATRRQIGHSNWPGSTVLQQFELRLLPGLNWTRDERQGPRQH